MLDRVTGGEVRARIGPQRMENMLRERSLCQLGHVITDGPPVHSTACTVFRGSTIEQRTRSVKDKLERHSVKTPTKIEKRKRPSTDKWCSVAQYIHMDKVSQGQIEEAQSRDTYKD